MKELSLNILDIAENSVKAGATLVRILLQEAEDTLTLTVADDGCGMLPDFLQSVSNPFCTTRTTRKVGLGIPLLKLAAEQTGGSVELSSRHISQDPEHHGTEVTAVFYFRHIDFTPLGDIVSTLITLIQGNPKMDFFYRHEAGGSCAELDTRSVREALGADIPLDSYEVLQWMEEYLREQYHNLQTKII